MQKNLIYNKPQCSLCLSGKSFLLLLLLLPFLSAAQDGQPYRKGKVKHRISVGPVLSFYKNDPHFAVNTKAKAGANVSYKSEILLGRKTNLLLGLEYMSQGLKFNGYYVDSGYTYLFDQTFAYTHELRYNEIQLPVAFKLALNREKDSRATAYIFGGVGFRYIFGSYTVITSDSLETAPYDGKGTIGFEHQLLTKNFNAFFHAGFGVQKNFRSTAKAVFFEMTYKYGISRLHYEGYKNSNNINIKESNLAITVGLRL